MTNIPNQDIEQQLARLTPSGAPRNLRQQVLLQLENECQIRPKKQASRMDRIANIAIAALVLVAAAAWFINIHIQERRIVSLLGPTPAERQAERAIQLMQPATDQEYLQSIREQLCVLLERAHRSKGNHPIHSVIALELGSVARREDETEKTRKTLSKPDRDTSDCRRGSQLESTRSA